ncbi:MAG: ribose ABC transporter permease [Phycisphaerae bacterium]|nr:ABC transporter permease [Phycisphaerae bacterium]NIP52456.1 ABC transporter permease [Phycisphaerae bacterium]NIS51672.1 ABC transporter permease [Phycisphaerae bacterium]NIU09265.1 ABC transporter permease [Phycisphaerae bacterium]NIU56925.1 ribose ABC transporter permease [Phycisphaerae bacterium]
MNKLVRQLLPFASLILVICALSALKPDTFLTMENFMNILRRSSVNGIIAIGMTSIIISAGIDLSVGSMLALCGMVGAYTMIAVGDPDPQGGAFVFGTVLGIFVGVICGFLNGVLITKLKLQPFIVTLGSMSAFRGISYVMNDGQPYNVPGYKYLGEGVVLGIPISVIIFVVIIAIACFLLRYSRLGRYTYAIGSNREAAFHAGVNVDRNLIYIYTFTGLLVGIAAMIATSRTVSAQPTAGIALELDIIAAVVIGGASLAGGRGTITGTIIGTLLISVLRNGCTLLGISTHIQLIVIGLIIILAVAVDQLAQTKTRELQS